MLNITDTAKRLIIEKYGISIKEGPFYARKVATRDGHTDLHIFRIKAVISPPKGVQMSIVLGKKDTWTRNRSIRFLGKFNSEGDLVDIQPISTTERKKLRRRVTRYKHLKNNSKQRKKGKQYGPQATTKDGRTDNSTDGEHSKSIGHVGNEP